MNISKNISSIREAKGIKQYQVAEMLGIEPPNYSRLEKRGDKLTVEQLEKIAVALGVSVKELLFGEKQVNNNEERVKELELLVSHWKELAETRNERIKIMQRHLDRYKELLQTELNDIVYLWAQHNIKIDEPDITEKWFALDRAISNLQPEQRRRIYRHSIRLNEPLNYAIAQGLLGEEGEVFRAYQVEFDKERKEAYDEYLKAER
jgi:transcriptional regulator with XRE-family HTH domain